ncbi:hypothetical protein VN12_17170 [Pirellula sp. SH-Sr6A]|uniref:hypothetical protein n=1 Tax=Pirellula sp. SH-Sr6A TaxID=1632865 RepID=UPI00078B83D1|nr:hypothetical protein [Pirellula sp. SH-Sr6A]AMV33863.1 hypothetical protein VN12_17170 [Pirellula sp. SH-Sr6A]
MLPTIQVKASRSFPSAWAIACLFSLLCITTTGCVRLASNLLYAIKGRNNPAEFEGLEEKKVAVLVSNNGVHTSDASSLVLARNINLLLQNKVKKVRMISQDEVDRMIQDQQLGKVDPIQVGERLGADFVIDIDVSDLKLYDGKTLYKGQCSASVTTYKCKDGREIVFRKLHPEFIYPKTGAPVTDMDEATFRRVYLMTLAERVSRSFYPYDPATDVARDAAISSAGF